MRFRESQGEAGSLEEVVLNLGSKGWVKYRPGRWVRQVQAFRVGGPACAKV